MRYLITGGAGFVGSHLADGLVARGDDVLVLDDLSTGRLENLEHLIEAGSLEFVEGSATDRDLVADCLERTDFCFHLASAVGVQLIVSRPLDTLRRNVLGVETVMGEAVRLGRPLLYTSTSEIYGKNSDGALHEEADRVLGSPFKARWSYATAKAFGEALAHSYAREVNAPIVVVRLFNTVGPRQSGRYGMVVPRLVGQALRDEDLTVFGNGTQTRCFVHVLDTVQALVTLADCEEARGDVFNVGANAETPIIELARRIIERTGSSSKVELISYDEAYDDGFEELGRRMPDTTRLRELTGWIPTRSVDDAIDDTALYLRQAETIGSNGDGATNGRTRVASPPQP
jgi:UDP-glucose 4-epimerase